MSVDIKGDGRWRQWHLNHQGSVVHLLKEKEPYGDATPRTDYKGIMLNKTKPVPQTQVLYSPSDRRSGSCQGLHSVW